MNGVSALTKEASESSLPLLPCEDTARSFMNRKAVSYQTLNLLAP